MIVFSTKTCKIPTVSFTVISMHYVSSRRHFLTTTFVLTSGASTTAMLGIFVLQVGNGISLLRGAVDVLDHGGVVLVVLHD